MIPRQIVEEYEEAQNEVPEGKRMLVMTSYPHLFDYSRNRVVLIDMPGTCSPGPGMPMMQNVVEFKNYLVGQGINFIIYDDFDTATGLYGRRSIQSNFWLESNQARILTTYILYVMDMLELLGTSGYAIGKHGSLTIL